MSEPSFLTLDLSSATSGKKPGPIADANLATLLTQPQLTFAGVTGPQRGTRGIFLPTGFESIVVPVSGA